MLQHLRKDPGNKNSSHPPFLMMVERERESMCVWGGRERTRTCFHKLNIIPEYFISGVRAGGDCNMVQVALGRLPRLYAAKTLHMPEKSFELKRLYQIGVIPGSRYFLLYFLGIIAGNGNHPGVFIFSFDMSANLKTVYVLKRIAPPLYF